MICVCACPYSTASSARTLLLAERYLGRHTLEPMARFSTMPNRCTKFIAKPTTIQLGNLEYACKQNLLIERSY